MNKTEQIFGGAFQIARKIFSSDIWTKKPATWKIIWVYILGKVNHKNNNKFNRGEGFFNLSDERRDIGYDVTYDMIRHAIAYFKQQKMIRTIKSTRGMLIKVLNYDTYQTLNNFKSTTESTVKAQSKHNQSSTINKNGNNVNNVNNTVAKATTLLIGKEKHYMSELEYILDDTTTTKKKYGSKTMAVLVVAFAKASGFVLPTTFDASPWSKPLAAIYNTFDKDADKTINFINLAAGFFKSKNLSFTPHTLHRDLPMIEQWLKTTKGKDISERRIL